jgi:hypothetical protein
MISNTTTVITNENYKTIIPLETCERDQYFNTTTETCAACSDDGLTSANCEFCGGIASDNTSSHCIKCKSGYILDTSL